MNFCMFVLIKFFQYKFRIDLFKVPLLPNGMQTFETNFAVLSKAYKKCDLICFKEQVSAWE